MTDIKVNAADLAITKAPNKLLANILGSRLVITMHDPNKNIGGLAHTTFPKELKHLNGIYNESLMYADNAIEALLEKMIERIVPKKALIYTKEDKVEEFLFLRKGL